MALVRLLGADGRLDPSHAFLARLAAVSEDTVQRALERMRSLGLLFWRRRLRRDSGTGWRCEQTSNAYVLSPSACDPQIAGAVQFSLKKKEGIEQVPADPTERQAAEAALKAARDRPGLRAALLRRPIRISSGNWTASFAPWRR